MHEKHYKKKCCQNKYPTIGIVNFNFYLYFISLMRVCLANNDNATLTPMLNQKYPNNNTAYSTGDQAVAQCSTEGLDQEL